MNASKLGEYYYQAEHDGAMYRVFFGGAVVVNNNFRIRELLEAVNALVSECKYFTNKYCLFTSHRENEIFVGDPRSSQDYVPIRVEHLCSSLYDLFLKFPISKDIPREDLMAEAAAITERHIRGNLEKYPWLNLKVSTNTSAAKPAVPADNNTFEECMKYAHMICGALPSTVRSSLPDNDLLAALQYACNALDIG